jgi:cell division protein FtsI/penicillin-binding protein 2
MGLAVSWSIGKKQLKFPFHLSQELLATELTQALNRDNAIPETLDLPVFKNDPTTQEARVYSTIDPNYSRILRGYFERYRPDYGAVAVINPDTGAILALESFVKEPEANLGHLAIRAPFPAASVFKIVTAAAAIDQGKAYAETVIPYNGRNHTLYRKNVKDQAVTRWTQHVTLREAFGKSINVVFGKLGLFQVGFNDLNRYAESFHFNKDFESELEIEKSQFQIDPTNMWELVESSAGFTDRTTLSPVHGALIASAILNDGVMPRPYVVNTVVGEKGETLYENKPKELETVMVSYSARQMQLLMQETVTRGTSRKNFRGLANDDSEFRFGGKTGSLDGNAVQGRTDWFVGYASHNDLRLAVGIVTVHKKYWTVKSSMLARLFFEDAFDQSKLISRRAKRKGSLHSSNR